jgi:hypothetical protein
MSCAIILIPTFRSFIINVDELDVLFVPCKKRDVGRNGNQELPFRFGTAH